MLELKDIVKIYQGGTVNETCLFNGFSLSIPDEQFVCVVGSNGSGKTSLLNIICGTIPIDEGQVLVGGENITHMPNTSGTAHRPRLSGPRTRHLPVDDHFGKHVDGRQQGQAF